MGAITKMFKKPAIPEARRMPDAQDPAAMAANEAERRKKMSTGGRESTNISNQDGYGSTILGS